MFDGIVVTGISSPIAAWGLILHLEDIFERHKADILARMRRAKRRGFDLAGAMRRMWASFAPGDRTCPFHRPSANASAGSATAEPHDLTLKPVAPPELRPKKGGLPPIDSK